MRNRLTKILATSGVVALAAWQFYLFAAFEDTLGDAIGFVDVQGDSVQLWLAIGFALATCVAGFFLFSRFLRYDTRDQMHITSQGHPQGVGGIAKGGL